MVLNRIVSYILIDQIVRMQFRALSWQEEQFNPMLSALTPFLNLLFYLHGMVVNNDINFLQLYLINRQKINKDIRG